MPVQINISDQAQIQAILLQAKHGDIFFKADGIRSGAVFFVQALDANGTAIPKVLIQKDETGSGYCSIPLAITLHFENPILEFAPLLENKKMGVRKTDWFSIELDAVKHAKIVAEITKGKAIASNRRIVYFVSGDDAPGYYIFNPDTPTDITNVWKKLNATIDEKYLQAEIYYLTEEDIEKLRSKNRKIHETKFINWLLQLIADTPLYIENIPADINQKEETITQNQTTFFVNVLQQAGINIVNTRMREYTDWNEKGERNYVDIDIAFIPKFLSETGQWGKILFWVNEEKNLYLPVPIWDESFKKIK